MDDCPAPVDRGRAPKEEIGQSRYARDIAIPRAIGIPESYHMPGSSR